ncbi:MAG: hypothetical protein L3J79_11605 [Candidatus Marinimicrobia bacterium]|nr:hypothetical protein [Candidatus Neomarinimicrobiota bacterium]
MNYFFYLIYNFLLLLALPVAWLVAYFNEKLGGSLSGQRDIKAALLSFNNKVKLDPKPIVWFHAASAGEFEQIKPLLARVRKLDVYIFQTFTSATIYYKAAHDDRFDGVSFLPWDIYTRVHRFVTLLNPAIMINTRHDVWPNLQLALRRNRIRNILINANLYQDSTRLKPLIKQVNQAVFQYIDHLYTGSDSLKILLEQLYSGPIDVVGDSRFDQVHERAKTNDSELIPPKIISDHRVIIYGSVGASDLDIVTTAIAKSLPNRNSLHVVVPHETMERDLVPWEVALYRHKIKAIRKTELDQYSHEPVIIWNSVGQLADLYSCAHLAYVGAGFSTGVHSVTEASIYYVPCAHGPKYDILAEATDLVDMGLSRIISSTTDLVQFLGLPDSAISHLSKQIERFMDARLGAADKIINQEFPLKR